jgi:hypothetical protein
MSIVDGVKFTWVIISSDSELSINLRYLGQTTSPAMTVVATALTNPTQTGGASSTMAGSQTLNAGWVSPSSITIKLEGGSTLYDADLITVVALPYGSATQPNATSTTITEPSTTNEPPTSSSPTSNESPIDSQPSTPVNPSDESTSSIDSKQSSDNQAKSNGDNCDPSYPDFCIASPPPDLNCADISKKRFTVSGSDPHGFDRDNDGIGCES